MTIISVFPSMRHIKVISLPLRIDRKRHRMFSGIQPSKNNIIGIQPLFPIACCFQNECTGVVSVHCHRTYGAPCTMRPVSVSTPKGYGIIAGLGDLYLKLHIGRACKQIDNPKTRCEDYKPFLNESSAPLHKPIAR